MTDSKEVRGWFLGCGTCDANFHMVNCAVVRVGGSCSNCEGWETNPEMSERDSLVTTELGWCGCGSPERIDELMLAYLSRVDPVYPSILKIEGDAELMLAYIADDLGWTEHGGSVYGAWLTDDGRTALTNLRNAGGTQRGDSDEH